CTAGLLEAIAAYLTGRTAAARDELHRIEQRADVRNEQTVRAMALTELAAMAIDDENWLTARALIREARAVSASSRPDEAAFGVLVRCVEARIAAHDSQQQEAQNLVRQSS